MSRTASANENLRNTVDATMDKTPGLHWGIISTDVLFNRNFRLSGKHLERLAKILHILTDSHLLLKALIRSILIILASPKTLKSLDRNLELVHSFFAIVSTTGYNQEPQFTAVLKQKLCFSCLKNWLFTAYLSILRKKLL